MSATAVMETVGGIFRGFAAATGEVRPCGRFGCRFGCTCGNEQGQLARRAAHRLVRVAAAVGHFRCVGCFLDVTITAPVDPSNPSQVPRCARCGGMTAPVDGRGGPS